MLLKFTFHNYFKRVRVAVNILFELFNRKAYYSQLWRKAKHICRSKTTFNKCLLYLEEKKLVNKNYQKTKKGIRAFYTLEKRTQKLLNDLVYSLEIILDDDNTLVSRLRYIYGEIWLRFISLSIVNNTIEGDLDDKINTASHFYYIAFNILNWILFYNKGVLERVSLRVEEENKVVSQLELHITLVGKFINGIMQLTKAFL
ncbi:MAG: hypothetical protein ACP6IQ_11045 [Candidatus Njordarchaeia archaeon]